MIIVLWFNSRNPKSFNYEINNIFRFWMFMISWFIIVPIIFFDFNISAELFYQGMSHDYSYLMFSVLPFIFITDKYYAAFIKLNQRASILALACGIVALVIVDKSFSSVSDREAVFSLPYYLWWVVTVFYPYMYLRFTYIDKNKIGLYLFILHILLSLFFLKRAGFVNAILLVVLVTVFSGNYVKKVKLLLIFTGIGLVFLFLFGNYISLLTDRFSQDNSNINEWDRNLELIEFFDKVSFQQLITGFGMNNYLKMYYVGELDKPVNALHIGIYNLIYKGGIFYLLFFFYLTYNIVKLYKFIQINSEIKIGFIIGIIYLIGFLFENSWSYVPAHFFKLVIIYRAIYLRRQLIDSKTVLQY